MVWVKANSSWLGWISLRSVHYLTSVSCAGVWGSGLSGGTTGRASCVLGLASEPRALADLRLVTEEETVALAASSGMWLPITFGDTCLVE